MFRPLRQRDVLPRQEYIAQSPHPRAVKFNYAKSFQDLKARGFTRRTKRVGAFVKEETYVAYKAHRLILPRGDEVKVYIGPVISAMEKVVYRSKYFIKKVPVENRPDYIMEHVFSEGASVFVSDYTGYESQFTLGLMETCELQLLDYMVQDLAEGEDIKKFFREIVGGWNDIRFNGGSVRLQATRMSGEMTTSLFNGFSNLMFMRFVCEEMCQCTNVRGVVEGDDGLFSMDCHAITPTGAHFAQLGLTIKLVQCPSIAHASFCGIVFDPHDKRNVTDPRKVLCNIGYSTSVYTGSGNKTLIMLLKAKCMSFYVQYPGCPIVEVLAAHLLRRMPHIDIRPLIESRNTPFWERERLRHVLGCFKYEGERPIGTGSRELVAELFDCPVQSQLTIEDEIRKHPGSGPFLSQTLLDIVPKDWIDYFDRYATHEILDESPGVSNPDYADAVSRVIDSRSCRRLATTVARQDALVEALGLQVPSDPVEPEEFE